MVNRDDTTTNECLPIKLNEVKKKKNVTSKQKQKMRVIEIIFREHGQQDFHSHSQCHCNRVDVPERYVHSKTKTGMT